MVCVLSAMSLQRIIYWFRLKTCLDPALADDPRVRDAINYAKHEVLEEFARNVRWIGPERNYSEEAKQFYGRIVKEVENEIHSEAKNEIKQM